MNKDSKINKKLRKHGGNKKMSYDIIPHIAEEILIGTPKSVRKVFEQIRKSGRPMRVTELQELTKLTDRTIRLALRRLYDLKLVIKLPDLEDLRSHFLTISPHILAEAA